MKNGFLRALVSLMLVRAVSIPVFSDDTELFSIDLSTSAEYTPKVLIIFDNSGSMGNDITTKKGYDPTATYSAEGDQNSLNDDFIYFSFDGLDGTAYVPTGRSEDKRFVWDINNCASSYQSLKEKGYFIGRLVEHRFTGNTGEWEEIRINEGANYDVIDCIEDFDLAADAGGTLSESISYTVGDVTTTVTQLNPANVRNGSSTVSATQGYSVDGAARDSTDYYGSSSENTLQTSGRVVTLYTANYLRWYHEATDVDNTVHASRMTVAKNVITQLIDTVAMDYGLMLYNYNGTDGRNNGGRVVKGIAPRSDSVTQGLIDSVNSLSAATWTPLCETLMEAKRYLSGDSVYYGKQNTSLVPLRDTSVESGSDYITPFSGECDSSISVIYITDGAPNYDSDADGAVLGLPVTSGVLSGCRGDVSTINDCDASVKAPVAYGTDNAYRSYLPVLAQWMHNFDLADQVGGHQTATVYTIGYGDDAIADAGNLLRETAERGGGNYFEATDGTSLQKAVMSALVSIYQETSSLVTPAVTSNNFDRTQTLDRIYYAMFEPATGPRWQGNLKKLRLNSGGVIVDLNDAPALNSDGSISDGTQTIWSSQPDGNDVGRGGVVEMLSQKSSRTLYTDSYGSGASLVDFSQSNLTSLAGSTAADLASYLAVSESELADHLAWISGVDVDDDDGDGDTSDRREDILGDPLHSRPLVINYGPASDSAEDIANPDIRILMGTNAGFLHMFQDSGTSVDENWAFIPFELLPRQAILRDNDTSPYHVYGLDGVPSVWFKDHDSDGKIEVADGDKVWVFIGQRRGGDAYYAFDLSNPDSPRLMWRIDAATEGFAELGQTWSTPVAGYIPGYSKPVVIFGGGYDTNQDSDSPGADTRGRAIFIADAETGTLKWSATPSGGTYMTHAFSHSIPSKVATLDSNSDGYIDRVYVGDSGGQLWRLDMPGTDTSTWSVIELADVSIANDVSKQRKFFAEPIIVRTYMKRYSTVTVDGVSVTDITVEPFDGILLGSGDRSKPVSETIVSNEFYMIRDSYIHSTSFGSGDGQTTPPAVITPSDLYDVTSDPVGNATTDADRESALIALGEARGWRYQLQETGEKSFGSGLVLDGKVYFTSYIPPDGVVLVDCSITTLGTGQAYVVDLHTGLSYEQVSINNWVPDDVELITAQHDDQVNGDGTPNSDGVDASDVYVVPVVETIDGKVKYKGEQLNLDARKIYSYLGEE